MVSQAQIKETFEHVANVLSDEPSLGLVTAVSVARIKDGLSCVVSEDGWTLNVDMPTRLGGPEIEPTPGVLGRAALGSCMAISYMLWASKLGIEISDLEVEVQADSDEGAILATSDAAAGYLELRYCVRIQSDASEADIVAMLDQADEHSPYRDVFTRPQTCIRQHEIRSGSS